jgi:DNA-binding transcriptional MerR regulator
MEQNLISKKELLDLTGISYGQLYRWKRKNLIPEEWFIKKSSFTGQETYFPKDKIFERISKIKDMKDDLSLNDIANMVSPVTINVSFSKNELVERNIVSNTTVTLYINRHPDTELFSFDVILFMYLVDKLIQSGEINIEEGGLILEMLEMNYMRFDGKDCDLFFVRKMGVSTCFLLMNPCEIGFESSLKIIARLNLNACIEELKIKIS